MKILMLNYEFPPLGGGAGNATFYLLKQFSQYKDLQIDLVTSSVDKYKEEHFSENIKIFYLDIAKKGNLHYQTNKDLLIFSLKSYFFARKLLRTDTYHLCHAFFGIPCGFVAMKLGIPYVVSLRGSDVPFYNLRFWWLDKLFFKRLSRRIWHKAKMVIANSKGLRNLALKSFPDQKIDVIHNGVDTEEFTPAYTKSDRLRILCISRLIRRKGIEYLIKAMDILKQEDVNLVIVGQGNEQDRLKQLAIGLGLDSKIEFKDYLPHQSISEVYHHSDVFVLPSLNEGMSNTVLEAMASGLPVVLTETGGIDELIDGNGFTVRKKDPQAIAEVLQKFLEDKNLVRKMGESSREIALKMSWLNVAESYYRVYDEVFKCVQ